MGFGGALKNIKNQVSSSLKGTVKSVGNANSLVFSTVGQSLASAVGSVGSVAGAATGVLRANPELAGVAGDFLGVPGLGGAFGGPAGGGGGFDSGSAGAAPASRVPLWVWIGGGIAALIGLILVLRKN